MLDYLPGRVRRVPPPPTQLFPNEWKATAQPVTMIWWASPNEPCQLIYACRSFFDNHCQQRKHLLGTVTITNEGGNREIVAGVRQRTSKKERGKRQNKETWIERISPFSIIIFHVPFPTFITILPLSLHPGNSFLLLLLRERVCLCLTVRDTSLLSWQHAGW